MFDTHCHLQFEAFQGTVNEVIERAEQAGITHIMIPGTDVVSSKKAVEIAKLLNGQKIDSGSRLHRGFSTKSEQARMTGKSNVNLYAAVGIHPHHVFEHQTASENDDERVADKLNIDLSEIEKLLENKNVVAVGEIGVDRYYYRKTRHINYQITEEFVTLQKDVLRKQLDLALKYKKSLILHNREAKKDLLEILSKLRVNELTSLGGRTVFHCCEPDKDLLKYAEEHKFFIGVDGDVTYSEQKAGFIKTVPLELLVLETDSPFLTPEPYRSQLDEDGKRPLNEPKNLTLIAEYIAKLKNISVEKVMSQTTENAKRLFSIA